jgi:nucleotide-binding universal stress UspA family protein
MFKTILVPVDLSELADDACRTACELARRDGARLHFLYVLPDYTYPVVAQYFPAEVQRQAQDDAATALGDYVAGLPLGDIEHQQHLRMGTVYREILDCAEEVRADLIVIASHAPRGIERLMLGSNAEKVAQRAHCSVLLLRPPHA